LEQKSYHQRLISRCNAFARHFTPVIEPQVSVYRLSILHILSETVTLYTVLDIVFTGQLYK